MTRFLAASVALLACLPACGSDPVKPKPAGADGTNDPTVTSTTLTLSVSAKEPVYVKLATPAVVSVDAAASSTDWDLAFVGYDVLTNGGISGPGRGSAFGPLDISVFVFPEQPIDVPFLITDAAGGVFLKWYAYDGSSHTLYSRFHVVGLRSGGALYKLQILGYYGDVQGSPVSALYQIRYAEVGPDGSGDTLEVHDLDGTLDGDSADADVPSGCLVLATGDTTRLTPNEAKQSQDWDVCFRREAISVNGGIGGPGSVTGVDLQAASTSGETTASVKKRTAQSEQALFDGTDEASLDAPGLDYRGDGITSAFTGKWVDFSQDPPVPTPQTAFLVVGADGRSRYLVTARSFDGSSSDSPGTVTLGIQPAVSP
ncbi:MAG TPA: HmuY family protein [Polyangiaceae bacterium]|nr:HmuY family protein [Polyangiaceae bacterium]